MRVCTPPMKGSIIMTLTLHFDDFDTFVAMLVIIFARGDQAAMAFGITVACCIISSLKLRIHRE
jgi:hypothetical protein